MRDRTKLLLFSIFVLAMVALLGVGITAFHCFREAAKLEAAGLPVELTWNPFLISLLITSIVVVAGGTILVRVVNPFIRLLENVKQRLEWKAAELDHFMRALSHDMTANSLLLQSSFDQLQAAVRELPDKHVGHSLLHMEACLQQSQQFLADLRELSRTGSVQMEACAVNVNEVIKDVQFEQAELLNSRGIELVVEPGLPPVWCNPNRVKQVLTNLIRNAAKHGCDKTHPRIAISRAVVEQSHTRQTWFRVFDNGAGIPAAHQQDIFLPGKRLPTAHADGTGMGLAIVKKVIDHYGGTIFVDPTATVGTSFIFSLPLPSPDQVPVSMISPLRRPHRRPTERNVTRQDLGPSRP